jgi:hypothetical protein
VTCWRLALVSKKARGYRRYVWYQRIGLRWGHVSMHALILDGPVGLQAHALCIHWSPLSIPTIIRSFFIYGA